MYGPYGPGWWPMWGMGWAVPVIIILVVIAFLTRLRRGPRTDRALDILRERYARGEITKEDFERMKRDLT